jgi:hypothetical protein
MAALDVTFEAFLYPLRSGVGVLDRGDVRFRLAQFDKDQLQEACARVQRHKPHVAEKWTDDGVKQLVAVWTKIRHA